MRELPAAAPALRTLHETAELLCREVDESPAALLRGWQQECGVADDEDLARLVRLAEQADSLEGLLQTVLLGQEADYEQASTRGPIEAVRLMTLHAAKGLEFPVVFICGVEDGLIPLRREGEEESDVEEERRLFYVGLTRAREEVLLLHAASRQRYGQRQRPVLSPFVDELPLERLEREQVERPRRIERAEQLSLW
jgi:superfamily I DNA/RNA helicase